MLRDLRRRLFPARSEPAPPAAVATGTGRRPALDDAAGKAAAARRRAEDDPHAAITVLEAYRTQYAPDPHVLHALCLAYQRAGRSEQAIAVAHEAIPLCFRRGQGLMAAELFESLEGDADALGLGRAELLALGGALSRTPHWNLGFRALASVLMRQPGDENARRELLRTAEFLEGQAGLAAEAAKVYQFLLVLTEDEERAGEIERRLAAALQHVAPPVPATAAAEPGAGAGAGAGAAVGPRWDDFIRSLDS